MQYANDDMRPLNIQLSQLYDVLEEKHLFVLARD